MYFFTEMVEWKNNLIIKIQDEILNKLKESYLLEFSKAEEDISNLIEVQKNFIHKPSLLGSYSNGFKSFTCIM